MDYSFKEEEGERERSGIKRKERASYIYFGSIGVHGKIS